MSSLKGNASNMKRKKRLTKAQMQLAIIKKRELDAKAQTIVERLLEPDINSQWLLENLIHINKCHMEDVIEERAIDKLCGYVLCKNLLTKVINQRYHISTTRNKVYDVSRRKHFCSSFCYCAANYLLEQMLSSPLWLREDEKSPEFRFLPENEETNIPGEEVIYKNSIDPKAESNVAEDVNNIEGELPTSGKVKGKCVTFQLPPEEKELEDNYQNSDQIQVTPFLLEDSVANDNFNLLTNELNSKQRKESLFQKERKLSKKSNNNADSIGSLVKRIESTFKEWITEDTLRLLFGEENDKQQIFQCIEKHEKYATLCQKLDELQLDMERKESETDDNVVSKPVPDYKVLQEEGKQLQLKVRSYLSGSVTEDNENVSNKSLTVEESSVAPLVDSQAPNAIRRRIFVDKINNVLKDLLQCSPGLYSHSKERVRVIKGIISTFALTPENIIFMSIEWNLVGLIMIKMISLIDTQLKNLIKTKDTSRYISMILMSYQLNPDYLDTFISSLR